MCEFAFLSLNNQQVRSLTETCDWILLDLADTPNSSFLAQAAKDQDSANELLFFALPREMISLHTSISWKCVCATDTRVAVGGRLRNALGV